MEDESTFSEPFPPPVKAPAKGQYETKLKSQGVQNPCQLSKLLNPTHDKFFGEKNGNWQEGRSSSSGTSGCLIEHSLSRRACSCVIPQRYPTPAEDADGQNMDPPMASPPSEHPLPHDEISSACSGGNVRLRVGKGRRGGAELEALLPLSST